MTVERDIERAALRSIWRRLDEKAPSGRTWREWFLAKYGRTVDAAAADFKRERDEQSGTNLHVGTISVLGGNSVR